MPVEAELPEIPVYDVGADFPIELARRVGVRAYDLLQIATSRTPRPVLRLVDHLSRRWLVKNGSLYLAEIDALAALSRWPGLYYLNVQYDWGCTTAIKPGPEGRSARLLRTLDWNVAGIGQFVVAARIANPLGAWLSLTWPAFTGVLQALAPGRFAAAINQPMPPRRVGLFSLDWLIAKRQVWCSPHIQPIHLLRRVFETAPDCTGRVFASDTPAHVRCFTQPSLLSVMDAAELRVLRQRAQRRFWASAMRCRPAGLFGPDRERQEVDASLERGFVHASAGRRRAPSAGRDVPAILPIGDGVGMEIGSARKIGACPAEQGTGGTDLVAGHDHLWSPAIPTPWLSI